MNAQPDERDVIVDIAPPLKWVGGKRKLLPELLRRLPASWNAYHEPFIGGGALFFALASRGLLRLDINAARIADINPDVINLYRALARDVDGVLECLHELAKGHPLQPGRFFAFSRDERNKLARGLSAELRLGDDLASPSAGSVAKAGQSREPLFWDCYWAALTLYLNRTGFNGLWRVNKAGDFNVPLGDYDHATLDLVREDVLRAAAGILGAKHGHVWCVGIRCCDFEASMSASSPGDFVFCDSPYAPASKTANFTAYASDSFSTDDQARLEDISRDRAARGIHVMLTHSDVPLIRELYSRPPWILHEVTATRSINSNPDKRGPARELIITSYATP